MAKKFVSAMFAVLSLFVGLACGQVQPTPAAQVPSKTATEVAAKPAWQQEWEKSLSSARQEGAVSISTLASPDQREVWRDGFKKAYGLQVEFITAAANAQLFERILSERRAGLYLRDIIMSGAGTYFTLLKPEGVLDAVKPLLLLPEVVDPKAWYGGSLPFLDREEIYVPSQNFSPFADIVANSDLVKAGEITTNKDLLDPRWRGGIVLYDPTIGGGGRTWAGMAYMALGGDFFRQFAKQEPLVTRDARLQMEWVAKGKYPVAVGIQQAVKDFLAAGAPLRQIVPADAAYASSGTPPALVTKAAHPNAARVFLNWLLTREGQTVTSKSFMVHSTRLDVPTDHLPPVALRQPGIVYINGTSEDTLARRDPASNEAVKILGLK